MADHSVIYGEVCTTVASFGDVAELQLYLRRRASLKSPLCNWKLCVPMGRTDSHDEAPFSLAKIICVTFQITNDWHQLLVSMPIVI